MQSKKLMIFLFSLFLLFSIFNPAITHALSEESIQPETESELEKNKCCTVKLVEYGLDDIKTESEKIDLKAALHIIKSLKRGENLSSFGHMFSIHLSNLVDFESYSTFKFKDNSFLQQFENNEDLNFVNKKNSFILFNMLCRVNAKIFGLGFVLGTHSIPIVSFLPGADVGGLFIGLGSVDVTGGILEDDYHSGFCIGGLIGFIGKILLVVIPMFPGPFIYIDGYSLTSVWL